MYPSVPSAPDPILAAIERHRRADASWDANIAAGNADDDNARMRTEIRAFWGLVEVVPTTTQGVWTLCDHLAEYAARERQFAEIRDYDHGRNWQFGVKLLENIRDAMERIERADTA